MSIPMAPEPGLLVLSILSARLDEYWPFVQKELITRFGSMDYVSEAFPFEFSDYYNAELGTPITRRLVAFERLRALEELADIKLFTNALEWKYREGERRKINLDPGFITLHNLVLATGKKFAHRIYLREGIWADLTLVWQKKQWIDFAWTFPDYADRDMKMRLTKLRQSYKYKLNNPHRSNR